MSTTVIVFLLIAAFLLGALVCCLFSRTKKYKKMERISTADYNKPYMDDEGKSRNEVRVGKALDAVLKIREFEINLYWKRATYFWAFIVLVYIGYGYLRLQSPPGDLAQKAELAHLTWFVSCFGLFLSIAWHLVNKGSKYWQENWENHLDLLEDKHIGSLYKTIVARPELDDWNPCARIKRVVAGPGAYSVSKINAILSFTNILIWVYEILWEEFGNSIDPTYERWLTLLATIIVIFALLTLGRTDGTDHTDLMAFRRKVSIQDKD